VAITNKIPAEVIMTKEEYEDHKDNVNRWEKLEKIKNDMNNVRGGAIAKIDFQLNYTPGVSFSDGYAIQKIQNALTSIVDEIEQEMKDL